MTKPNVGDRLVTGFVAHKSLRTAVVLSVVEHLGCWIALVRIWQPRRRMYTYEAIHEISHRVGLWRTWAERRAEP